MTVILLRVFLALCVSAAVCHAADEFAPEALAARIARVESGLLPPARLKGDGAASWSIAARQAAHRVPGVSVAVISEGKIEWARGYGVAKAGEAAAVTPDTLFQAASLSKAVAAAGALTLVESGVLTLDADVNQKLTSWKVPASPVAADQIVTLRRLLSHTAGLTVHGFSGYAAGTPIPTLVQVLDGEPPANSAAIRIALRPGSQWQYSGGGYTVAQQLMLDATGEKDFAALLRRRVLEPAGMVASTYEQPLPAALGPHAAAGHGATGAPIPGDAHVHPEQAAAGLWTTPSDLARFLLALQHALDGRGPADRFLTRETAEAMITPPMAGSDYGLGIGVIGTGEKLQLAHNGSNAGFRCDFVFYPRTGRGAVVMTNSDSGGTIIPEILRSIAREYQWPDYQMVEKKALMIPPSIYADFSGRYERENTPVLVFRLGEHFYIRIGDRPRVELFPQSEHEFFTLDSSEIWSFERTLTGGVTHAILHTAPPQLYRRLSPPPAPAFKPERPPPPPFR